MLFDLLYFKSHAKSKNGIVNKDLITVETVGRKIPFATI